MASPGDVPGAPGDAPAATGRLFVGTSGFSYAAWAPKFYPPGLRAADLLAAYGDATVLLRDQQHVLPPSERGIGRLVGRGDARPTFRFAVKAQRGGSMRALLADPGRDGRLADRAVPLLRGQARLRALPRPGRGDPRRRTPGGPARRPGRPTCRSPSSAAIRRGRSTRCSRCSARAGAAWCSTDLDEDAGAADAPGDRLPGSTSGCAGRRTTRPSSRRGPTGSCRSSMPGAMPTSCSATTRTARHRCAACASPSSSRSAGADGALTRALPRGRARASAGRPSHRSARPVSPSTPPPGRRPRAGPGAPRCRGSDARRRPPRTWSCPGRPRRPRRPSAAGRARS